jgi:hypothetical protein
LAIVPKLVNQVGLGHADASIADRKNFVLLVGSDTDIQLLVRVEDRGIGQRWASDLVEGIRGVGDEFAQKYPPVGVGVFEGGQRRKRQECVQRAAKAAEAVETFVDELVLPTSPGVR